MSVSAAVADKRYLGFAIVETAAAAAAVAAVIVDDEP